ncbi:tetratricopeptide repeat protein [Paractinoplanes globisporus]|uniref:Tetratricopeptide repeat protein n=1 Tax=Paractinoplanes globisporus TaxID=113565 RepID=A0ABW6WVZ9_9ACTN|nr:tetratricopeptide repeat protein [Actinoplanes globisporus]
MNEAGTAVAMAAVQFQRGDASSAAELLGPVLAAEPDNVRALVLMTHAQLALKQPELAFRVAHQAVLVAPESAEALGALSRAFTGLDRHDDAVRLAQRAAELEPENAYRHNRVAWALLGDGQRGVEAEHAARLAVQLDPNEADFRITYAMVMKQLDYTDRARQALRDALALEPDNAVAQHELATLDVVHRNPFALGRLARGASGLAGALRADPRQQASRFMLDVALRRFLVYTAVLLAVLAYVGWRMTEFSVGGARVVAGAAALAPMLFAAYFVVRLDRSLRAYLLTVLTQGRQRIAAIGAAICLALLLASTVAPAGSLPWLLGIAAIGGFAVRLLTVSASNAHVRSAGVNVSVDRVSIVLWWVVIGCVVAAIVLEIDASDEAWWFSVGALLLVLTAVICLVILTRRRRARRGRFRGIRS